jgi:hypothetical protein
VTTEDFSGELSFVERLSLTVNFDYFLSDVTTNDYFEDPGYMLRISGVACGACRTPEVSPDLEMSCRNDHDNLPDWSFHRHTRRTCWRGSATPAQGWGSAEGTHVKPALVV